LLKWKKLGVWFNLLKPKRSVLGGMVKSYAVGYGLNEIA
jgi:hypothetical protein